MGGLGFRGDSAGSAVVWRGGVRATAIWGGNTGSCTLVLGRGCEGTLSRCGAGE